MLECTFHSVLEDVFNLNVDSSHPSAQIGKIFEVQLIDRNLNEIQMCLKFFCTIRARLEIGNRFPYIFVDRRQCCGFVLEGGNGGCKVPNVLDVCTLGSPALIALVDRAVRKLCTLLYVQFVRVYKRLPS